MPWEVCHDQFPWLSFPYFYDQSHKGFKSSQLGYYWHSICFEFYIDDPIRSQLCTHHDSWGDCHDVCNTETLLNQYIRAKHNFTNFRLWSDDCLRSGCLVLCHCSNGFTSQGAIDRKLCSSYWFSVLTRCYIQQVICQMYTKNHIWAPKTPHMNFHWVSYGVAVGSIWKEWEAQ